jgi:hypothetical protein
VADPIDACSALRNDRLQEGDILIAVGGKGFVPLIVISTS